MSVEISDRSNNFPLISNDSNRNESQDEELIEVDLTPSLTERNERRDVLNEDEDSNDEDYEPDEGDISKSLPQMSFKEEMLCILIDTVEDFSDFVQQKSKDQLVAEKETKDKLDNISQSLETLIEQNRTLIALHKQKLDEKNRSKNCSGLISKNNQESLRYITSEPSNILTQPNSDLISSEEQNVTPVAEVFMIESSYSNNEPIIDNPIRSRTQNSDSNKSPDEIDSSQCGSSLQKNLKTQIYDEKKEMESYITEFNRYMEKYIDSKKIFSLMTYTELEKDQRTKPIIAYIDGKLEESYPDPKKRKVFKSKALDRRRAAKKREMDRAKKNFENGKNMEKVLQEISECEAE